MFDADVVVCALGFEAGAARAVHGIGGRPWTDVVTAALGVPALPALRTDGTLGDRAALNANFRDEYYGMVPAVDDDGDGPPLVTSGLIDPGRCHWGERPVRFARRRFAAPGSTSTRSAADAAWATRQARAEGARRQPDRVLEAVADPDGGWLPGVPVITVHPATPAPTCGRSPPC